MRSRFVPLGIAFGLAAAAFLSIWQATAPLATGAEATSRLLLGGGVGLLGIASILYVRQWARLTADRCAPERYDAEQELSALSQVLASARTFDAVVAHTKRSLTATLRPGRALLFRRDTNGAFLSVGDPTASRRLWMPRPLASRVGQGEMLICSESESDSYGSLWSRLGIELLLPLPVGGPPIGLLALGPKASRRAYDERDLGFLRTAGNQIAMAMTNAAAFDQLADLNHDLERLNQNLEHEVQDRTAALHSTNAELSSSLGKLRQAYQQLERTQVSLLRSQRLATLGRLTSGLAHEMNTPLGAVLNSLKMIADLAQEYGSSVEDPEVLPDDHREIAHEILGSARAATDWANKAAAYLRSIKVHGRESRAACESFLVAHVIDEVRTLIVHRLRSVGCAIDFREEPSPLELRGDRGRLGQVLTNLVANAIDAYEDRGIRDGRIEIRATRGPHGSTSVRVSDWAGGVPPTVLPHIFDELYTTKGPGRGTGLGLWISRSLIEECFGGTLDVITSYGGSCFIAELPAPEADDIRPSEPTPEIRITPTGNGDGKEGARGEGLGASS